MKDLYNLIQTEPQTHKKNSLHQTCTAKVDLMYFSLITKGKCRLILHLPNNKVKVQISLLIYTFSELSTFTVRYTTRSNKYRKNTKCSTKGKKSHLMKTDVTRTDL